MGTEFDDHYSKAFPIAHVKKAGRPQSIQSEGAGLQSREKMEFKGSLEQLTARIEAAGITGHWNDEGVFHEFVADDGAVLNWWPKTSAITIAGKPESRPGLEALFGGDRAG